MKKRVLIVFIILAFLLCGCKGYRETDSEYFVTAVCFQKEKDGFKAHIEVLAVSEDNKKSESKVFTAKGETPYSAVYGTTSLMPKSAVFDHCGTAIIDENINGKDLRAVIEYLYDTKNLNLGIYMFVSSDIKGVLECNSQSSSVGYDIMATETNIVKTSGISFKNKYYEIRAREIQSGGFCLPKIGVKDNRPEISGEIIYSDYYPVLLLEKDEAETFNLIYSGSSGGEISVGGDRCRVNGVGSKVTKENGVLKIKLNCRYRFHSDDNGKLKAKISALINKLYGNKALKILGVKDYKEIYRAEVTVNAE